MSVLCLTTLLRPGHSFFFFLSINSRIDVKVRNPGKYVVFPRKEDSSAWFDSWHLVICRWVWFYLFSSRMDSDWIYLDRVDSMINADSSRYKLFFIACHENSVIRVISIFLLFIVAEVLLNNTSRGVSHVQPCFSLVTFQDGWSAIRRIAILRLRRKNRKWYQNYSTRL